MIAAGFGIGLSSLSWSNGAVLFTIGITFDLVAGVLFLHVILAFPTGHLRSRLEVALVAVGYFTAFALQIVGLLLGGFGDDNQLNAFDEPDAATDLLHVQLVVLAAIALISFVILLVRRRTAGRKLGRSLALVIDSFSLVLVMLAFLFLAGAFGLVEGGDTFENIRRATFVALGLAPLVFLVGVLLRAPAAGVGRRPAARAQHRTPRPSNLRAALARALRDPSLELAYWLPDFEAYADLDGRPVELPDERRGTRGHRGRPRRRTGRGAAARSRRSSTSPSSSTRWPRRQASRSRTPASSPICGPGSTSSRSRAPGCCTPSRASASAWNATCTTAPSSGWSRCRSTSAGSSTSSADADPDARDRLGRGARPGGGVARRAARPRPWSAPRGRERARSPRRARRARGAGGGAGRAVVDLDERLPEPVEVAAYYVVSESLTNIGKHAHATARLRRRHPRSATRCVIEIVDDGVGGADTERGSGLRGLADRVEALGGRLRIWTPAGWRHPVLAEVPCGS